MQVPSDNMKSKYARPASVLASVSRCGALEHHSCTTISLFLQPPLFLLLLTYISSYVQFPESASGLWNLQSRWICRSSGAGTGTVRKLAGAWGGTFQRDCILIMRMPGQDPSSRKIQRFDENKPTLPICLPPVSLVASLTVGRVRLARAGLTHKDLLNSRNNLFGIKSSHAVSKFRTLLLSATFSYFHASIPVSILLL